jgi:hypothetical protein
MLPLHNYCNKQWESYKITSYNYSALNDWFVDSLAMIYQSLRSFYGWLIWYNSAKGTDGINVNISRKPQ